VDVIARDAVDWRVNILLNLSYEGVMTDLLYNMPSDRFVV